MKGWSAVVAVVGLMACGGGSGAAPAQPTAPVDESRGTFTLQGAGYENVTNTFTAANNNLVFCRREAPLPNTIWIRLAASRTADGEQSPHIDIDLCNFAGSSTYSALHDTVGPRTCSQGPTLAVWWHDGAREFVSRETSGPCRVSVTQGAGFLEGSFECAAMRPRDGSAGPGLDVRAGSFRCNF